MASEEVEREEIERDALIATVLSASTPEQRHSAEALIIAWMKSHPKDIGILDAGEQLAMMSERYDQPAGEARILPAA